MALIVRRSQSCAAHTARPNKAHIERFDSHSYSADYSGSDFALSFSLSLSILRCERIKTDLSIQSLNFQRIETLV